MPELRTIRPDGWNSPIPYSPAVAAGGLLFVAGQVALDPVTGEVVGDDVTGQLEQVFANLDTVLEAAGVGRGHLVRLTVYLTRAEDFTAMNEAYRRYLGAGPYPARVTVIAGLALDTLLVEIDAIAVAG